MTKSELPKVIELTAEAVADALDTIEARNPGMRESYDAWMADPESCDCCWEEEWAWSAAANEYRGWRWMSGD
jgi:hypothetical protein